MVTVTKYVWDPVFDCVTSELDENNAVKAVYHNEPLQYGGVLSQRRGNTSHYHHHDALGSTRFLTDSSGNVTDTYLHDSWGNLIASSGTTVNPFRWIGRYGYYFDSATGLFYVRARMYQPAAARWVSVDPIREVLELLYRQSVPEYQYCSNNSLRFIDRSGLIEIVLEKGDVNMCGGWSAKYSFQDNSDDVLEGTPYVVLQLICPLDGWVRDCQKKNEQGVFPDLFPSFLDPSCGCNKKPKKDCRAMCFIEFLGGKRPGESVVTAEDNHELPHYSKKVCSSEGNWKVTQTLRVMEINQITSPILRNIFSAPRELQLNNGCIEFTAITSGAILVSREFLPPWWKALTGMVGQELEIESNSEWSCCGYLRIQQTTFATGETTAALDFGAVEISQ